MKYLLLLFLFVGCQRTFVRHEVGVGTNGPLSNELQSVGKNISAVNTGFKVGSEIGLTDELKLDILVGPTITHPFGGPDSHARAFSLELGARLRLEGPIEPYIMPFIGPSYLTDKWEPQETNWGFTLGLAVGARTKVSEKYWAFLEYRFWHESNGSKVFGTKGPNPGFNLDMIMFGLEFKW